MWAYGGNGKISVYDQSSVFENIEGDLFVVLSNEHGNKRLKLSFVDDTWITSELTLAQWNELDLTMSQYLLSFGQFLGDTLEDFKLINPDTLAEIIVEQTSNGYIYHKPVVNIAPVISGIPPMYIAINKRFSFKPEASDANNDNLTFSIANKPDWAEFDQTTGELSGISVTAGIFENIVIAVTDSHSEPVQLPTFSINVTTNKILNIKTDLLGTPLVQSQGDGGAN